MKKIVITYPLFLQNEAEYITALFDSGLEILHLRKPDANEKMYEQILLSLPEKYHERIMLHDFFELAEKYNVRGVHLNRRNPEHNGTKKIKISKSCHTIQELKMIDKYDYVFLSPIFNSISKAGYESSFSDKELFDASNAGLINEKVIALGGIDINTLPLLQPYNFGGVAVLGAIWEDFSTKNEVIERFLEIRKFTLPPQST